MQFHFKENQVEASLQFGNLVISGDEQYGYRPYELLISSIAGCSGLVFKRIVTKQRLEIESLVIEAEVERNKNEANRVEKITLHFKVRGQNLNEKNYNEIWKFHESIVQ